MHFEMMSSLGDCLSIFVFIIINIFFYFLEWDESQERNKTGTNVFNSTK